MNEKVLFAFKGEKVPNKNTTLPNKQELFAKLAERDLDPIVSLNAESAFDEQGVHAHEPIDESDTRHIGHVAMNEVGLIMNRLDRSFYLEETFSKKDGRQLPHLPEQWQAANVPTVNPNAIRSLAFRKERMQREVLEPLGLGIPTQLIRDPIDAAIFIHEQPAEHYVVKPNNGTSGKNVAVLAADDVLRHLTDTQHPDDMIIQPKYDFSRPFSDAIKPFDVMSTEAFDAWSKSAEIKELRMYAMYAPSVTRLFPVGRALKDGTDHWFFVDPATVPDQVFDDARSTVERAARNTGARAVYAAIDFGYGSLHPNEDPGYHVIEFNGRMPYLIGYDKHPVVADKLREAQADQIRDVIDEK